MKKSPFLLFFILLLSLYGCPIVDHPSPESEYKPVIMNRPDFENSISLKPAKTIIQTGKIYVKGSYLFINEPNEGFHIFNNSNPSNPLKKGFLKVPGSSDIAIKNDVLYINTATDLISIKVNSTYNSIVVTKRIKNIFSRMISPDGYDYYNLSENEVITNWILK